MDLSKVSLQTWETLRDSIALGQAIEDMSVERLTAVAKEFANDLPMDSPVMALIDGLVDRINELDKFTDHIIGNEVKEIDRLTARVAELEVALESHEQVATDTYNALWAEFYPDKPDSWEYPGQIVIEFRGRLKELEAALRPFALYDDIFTVDYPDGMPYSDVVGDLVTLGDGRAAAEALGEDE